MNSDLYQNQLDIELQTIISQFGKLLRKIVETIDKYGLKKRNLNKHRKDEKNSMIVWWILNVTQTLHLDSPSMFPGIREEALLCHQTSITHDVYSRL